MSIDPRITWPSACSCESDLARLQAALQVVARLLLDDAVYVPLFERLEEDIRQGEERQSNGPQARARALLARTEVDLKTR